MFPKWLSDRIAEDDAAQLQKCLSLFDDPKSDGTALRKAAQDVEELEKRWLPESPEQLVAPELKGRILVCPVGLRPMPVILTTLIIAPQKLYLLHTEESRRTAESIRDDPAIQQLGLDPIKDILLREISLTDAPQNYDRLRSIIKENPNQGVVVDITGGVKVMGTSLASAAFWLRVPVIYLLGEEVRGIVRPFSERLQRLENPFDFFGSSELRSIQKLFQSGDYDAALALCRDLQESIGDVTTLGRLDVLIDLIGIYRDWDAFAHSSLEDAAERKLAGRLRANAGKTDKMRLRFVSDQQAIMDNIEFLQKLEESWKPEHRSLHDIYRLVDIFVSAQRRAKAGKFDDAIGRLYRCLEMSASLCLVNDCQIGDVTKPNLDFFVQAAGSYDQFLVRFREKAGFDFPVGQRPGLKVQMTLLQLSKKGHHAAVGGIYAKLEADELIEKRNRSILAHGTVAVAQDEYSRFEQQTQKIVDMVVGAKGEFERLRKQATHPSIEIEL